MLDSIKSCSHNNYNEHEIIPAFDTQQSADNTEST
jgi:hypothetical protein